MNTLYYPEIKKKADKYIHLYFKRNLKIIIRFADDSIWLTTRVRQIYVFHNLSFTSVKVWTIVELLPKVSNLKLPEFWYPVATFPLIHCSYVLSGERMFESDSTCWPFEQIFRPLTSLKGWRIVELLPKVISFQSWLTWILISCYNFPPNSLLLCFICRNVARMANKSVSLPFEQ